MNLTTLRKSYSKLINSFKEAGVVLNESQQGNLDSFMLMLEKKLTENRDQAIRTTKKIVAESIEKKYKDTFESVIANLKENQKLQLEVQKKIAQKEAQKTISEAVDNYLDLYMEKVLPQKSIVDYERLQTLEKTQSTLKEALKVGESEDKVVLEKKNEELSAKLSETKTKLNEAKKEISKTNLSLEIEKGKAYLNQMIQDLPDAEAKIVKESLNGASYSEIKMKYRGVVDNARKTILKECSCTTPETKPEETKPQEATDESPVEKNVYDVTTTDNENPIDGNDEPVEKNLEESIDTILGESEEFDSEDGSYSTSQISESIDDDVMKSWIKMVKGI